MTKYSKVLAAVFAGALTVGATGGAFAAQYQGGYNSSFNTIKSINGGTITLTDGTSYAAPYGYNVSKLKAGDRVAITWYYSGTTRDATNIVLG